MRYPWANTLLLVLVPAALVTGYLGLTNGHSSRAWILWLHAIVAYGIVSVTLWKVAVIRRSIERKPIPTASRPLFLLMAYLAGFVLLTGIAWAWFGRTDFQGTSLMTLHAAAAVVMAGIFAWHVIDSRVVFRVPRSRDRRAFLRLAVAGTAGVVLWQGGLVAMRLFNLPGASRRFTGSYETGSYTGQFPAVSWLFDDPDPVSQARLAPARHRAGRLAAGADVRRPHRHADRHTHRPSRLHRRLVHPPGMARRADQRPPLAGRHCRRRGQHHRHRRHRLQPPLLDGRGAVRTSSPSTSPASRCPTPTASPPASSSRAIAASTG